MGRAGGGPDRGVLHGKAPAELYDNTHPDPRTLICPYRGLGVFREEDQAFYFGREPDLEKLVSAVDHYPVVAIVGASGSGKSSVPHPTGNWRGAFCTSTLLMHLYHYRIYKFEMECCEDKRPL